MSEIRSDISRCKIEMLFHYEKGNIHHQYYFKAIILEEFLVMCRNLSALTNFMLMSIKFHAHWS